MIEYVKKMKTNFYRNIGSVVLSFLVISIYSRSTTWLYSHYDYGDSAIFHIIGKYWAFGNLPYISLWDQKGPLIFFLEMLGCYLPGTWGIFLLQVLSLSITFNILFKYIDELEKLWAKVYTFMVFIIAYTCVNAEGNLIEEFMLPLLMICTFKIYSWAKCITNGSSITHKWQSSFMYGCVLGCSLMTRLTNALGICGAVFVISIILIINKEWKNLIHNVLAYAAGFLVIVIPFFVYFYHCGCFEDMWFATFTYNLHYAGASSLYFNGIKDIVTYICTYGICFALFFSGLVKIAIEKGISILSCIYIGLSAFMSLWFLKSNGYTHYAMLSLPYILLICIEWFNYAIINKSCRLIGHSLCLIYLVFVLGLSTGKFLKHSFLKDTTCDEQVEQLTEIVKKYRERNIVLYNLSPIVYLKADVKPCYKYFANQDFQASKSDIFRNMVVDEFEKCTADLIIIKHADNSYISDILKNNYMLETDYGEYRLYKRSK